MIKDGAQKQVARAGSAKPRKEIERRPASWPTAIGVTGIVLACLGIVTGLLTAGAPLWVWAMASGKASLLVPREPLWWVLVVDGVLAVAVWAWGLLLFQGVINRSSEAMVRAVTWAWLKLGYNLVSAASVVVAQWAWMEGTANAPEITRAPGGGALAQFFLLSATLVSTLITVIHLVVASVWPAFLLLWVRRWAVQIEVDSW